MKKPCFEGWLDKEANAAGRCCCNCRWQRPISGHPWNKGDMQGSVLTIKGWGCTFPEMPMITFLDIEHSMCEMHEWRDGE